jgi:hypothetical protein
MSSANCCTALASLSGMSRQSPLTVAAPLLLSTIVSHAAHHRENGPSRKEHDPVRYQGREESIDASEP